MIAEEFWKIFEEEIRPNLESYAPMFIKNPVGGDGGVFALGLFKNEKGVWCIEETMERSNHPYHNEYASEELAVKTFFNQAVLLMKRESRQRVEKKYASYL